MDWNLSQLDLLIKKGQSGKAQQFLREKILRQKERPDRRDAVEVAALCRRCGWVSGGLLVLNPWVRPSVRKNEVATGDEKVEYAAGLINLGLRQEGRKLLSEVSSEFPQRNFVLATSYFSEWEYNKPLPLLELYTKNKSVSEYQIKVGMINYVAALVSVEQFQLAIPIIQTLKIEYEKDKNFLLLGNLFEIEAQAHIKLDNLSEAKICLAESEKYLSQHSNIDIYYLQKWKLVLQLKAEGFSLKIKNEFKQLMARAKELQHWETWRDCDFQMATFLKNKKQINHLYFGTPHEAFRQRIIKESGIDVGNMYLWTPELAKGAANKKKILLDTNDSTMKQGFLLHKLLLVLSSDFYQPQTVQTLFAEIFPDRYYSPQSSPTVIHQLLKRFRIWLGENGYPLELLESKGFYWLQATGRIKIKLHSKKNLSSDDFKKNQLEKIFAKSEFNRSMVSEKLSCSDRAANYLIKNLLADGFVEQIKFGPKSLYRLT
jgi:hypothetical protein